MAGGELASAEGISNKVRRIAILVTSLDATAGRQLLMAMPGDLSRQVRRAMSQLGSIDADEQRQIMAEFRMQAMSSGDQPASHTTAHSTDNAPSRPANQPVTQSVTQHTNQREFHSAADSHSPHSSSALATSTTESQATGYDSPRRSHADHVRRPWQLLDVETLGDLLRGERATVIAVVLSQLDSRQAASLLEKLPRSTQHEVIVNLTKLGQIDPDTLTAIDDHLAGRIADFHHRRSNETESVGRMQDLLSAASPDLRQDWQSVIQDSEPMMAQRMGLQPTAASKSNMSTNSQAAREFAEAVQRSSSPAVSARGSKPATSQVAQPQTTRTSTPTAAPRGTQADNVLDMLANNVVTTVDSQVAGAIQSSQDRLDASDHYDHPHILPFTAGKTLAKATRAPMMRFDEILDLPAEQIGEILSEADSDVVLLALAGASPAFMKRFISMLERQDAKALQTRLRQLTAINLQDVDEAQRRLCELALQSIAAASQKLETGVQHSAAKAA